MRGLSSIPQYLNESKSELKKVTWPTRKDTVNHTILVIGFSLGIAIFLGLADYVLSTIFENFILK